MKKIDSLNLDDLVLNPFLIRTLNLQRPEEIVEFFVNQRFQRGVVTAFGGLLEKGITKLFAEAANIPDIDLKFVRNDKNYYMQMKSGPEGFTGPALKRTIERMQELKRQNPNCVTLVAFAYGTEEKLSKVWGRELEQAVEREVVDKVLIGRAFWEFVLGDKDGYKIVLELFTKAGIIQATTLGVQVRNLETARKEAITRILKQWKEKYGDGLQSIGSAMENNL